MSKHQAKPVIQMDNVTRVFTTAELETHALRGINLTVNAGDYVSISGPSGCGKSTLLSILGLLDSPSGGKYILDGNDVSQLSINEQAIIRNQKTGFVFQAFNLIDELSVYDNVALPLTYREPEISRNDIKERVQRTLDRVEMGHRTHHRPNQLSGGQQQRIAIARALVGQPHVLFVDEPTGNLDSKNGDAVMALLHDLNVQGTTICMVTHDPRYANQASIQLHLLDGKIMDNQAVTNTTDFSSHQRLTNTTAPATEGKNKKGVMA